MNSDYRSLGLEKDVLYEVLVTTVAIGKSSQIIPNTACMGIRIVSNNLITMKPYPHTTTFQNVKRIPIVILNFIDDIFLYMLASLKELNLTYNLENESKLTYDFLKINFSRKFQEILKGLNFYKLFHIPFINSSWAVIICEVESEKIVQKVDQFGSVNITEFFMNIVHLNKFKESFKLYNRAENLILEVIILATRLKIASEMKDTTYLRVILDNMREKIETIHKFNKNERISKILVYLTQYMEKFKI